MGKNTMSTDTYKQVHSQATYGGTRSATAQAEERVRRGKGLNPLVDPKGPAHLGPVRLSLPRFEQRGNVWVLTIGIPMPSEDLLDTTGSMGDNVDLAFGVLPKVYNMLVSGTRPILGRYDTQIATANFNDIEDSERCGYDVPTLCRSQFEMDEKIAEQMAMLVPGKCGCGNQKEDPQFGLFAAAYLTKARINEYGLKSYHFTISDEPVVEHIDYGWLRTIFGDNVLERVKETGYSFSARDLPSTAQVVKDLQTKAHAFFFQVGDRTDVTDQWTRLYGADHVVKLPEGTRYLHCVKSVVIGLTEGVLDLTTAKEFLRSHDMSSDEVRRIIRAVSHIPLGAQMLCPNFHRLPKAGDIFREKTDLWPLTPDEVAALNLGSSQDQDEGEVSWL